jgi:hypothetical protein
MSRGMTGLRPVRLWPWLVLVAVGVIILALGKVALVATNPTALAGLIAIGVGGLVYSILLREKLFRDSFFKLESEIAALQRQDATPGLTDPAALLQSLAVRIRSDFKKETKRNFWFGILQTIIGYVIGNFLPLTWVTQLSHLVFG